VNNIAAKYGFQNFTLQLSDNGLYGYDLPANRTPWRFPFSAGHPEWRSSLRITPSEV
jgi:hypothetical protein